MGYAVYNRSLYRNGFRPYLATNPAAAASGMGGTPFDPEYLHGVRRQPGYPFTERGGWRLGGLGDAAPNGSVLTYRGQWQTTNTKSAQDILNAVIAALPGDGFSVTNVQSSAGLLANTELFGIAEGGQQFTVTLQLLVNGPGFAQAQDAGSIVDHEVYAASGVMPLSSATTTTGMGGDGAVLAPGQSAPVDAASWLEQNAWWIGAGLLAVLVLPRVL